MAAVFRDGPAPGDRFFNPIESLIFRLIGTSPDRQQRWSAYAASVLAFSAVSILGLYLLLRLQGSLPFNPASVRGMSPSLAFNTAISFVTDTHGRQAYSGELAMSHLAQMIGLVVAQFTAGTAGLAVAIALVRGLASTAGSSATSGSTPPERYCGCSSLSPPASQAPSPRRRRHGAELQRQRERGHRRRCRATHTRWASGHPSGGQDHGEQRRRDVVDHRARAGRRVRPLPKSREHVGTLDTASPLFGGLVFAVVIIVGGHTFLPAFCLSILNAAH